jgi:hypothetical protein
MSIKESKDAVEGYLKRKDMIYIELVHSVDWF